MQPFPKSKSSKNITIFILAATILFCCNWSVATENWQIQITEEKEPGEKMLIRGVVYNKAGEIYPGVNVHVYHTDNTGYYSPNGENERNHRLKGDMTTNEQGVYQFSTIRPAPYPNNRIPAHVHYVVTTPNGNEQDFELVFEGDPNVTERQRSRAARQGDFWGITQLTKNGDGVWEGSFDLYLKY